MIIPINNDNKMLIYVLFCWLKRCLQNKWNSLDYLDKSIYHHDIEETPA